MKRFTSLIIFGCLVAGTSLGGDIVRLNWTASMREYCHVLTFPSGWKMPMSKLRRDGSVEAIAKFGLEHDYEVRVPGLLSTRFLVRGVESYSYKEYTGNIYEVDLSDPKAIASLATEEAWKDATPIPLRYVGPGTELAKRIQSFGHEFAPTGSHGETDRLSPDGSLLVLQNWTGKLGAGGSDVPLDFSIGFSRDHGKLFFDAYSTDTGKKLVTITANFSPRFPEEIFGRTGWITERYFFIPLDQRRERCLICDFGRKR